MKKRLFLALPLPDKLQQELGRYLQKKDLEEILKNTSYRIVPLNNLHFTVLFLGFVDDSLIPEISLTVKNVSSIFSPLTLKFKNISAAPATDKQSRMIWAVFYESSSFNYLSCEIFNALQKILNKQNILKNLNLRKKQVPHITLIRFKKKVTLPFLPQPKIQDELFTFPRLYLMESKLLPDGATYSSLASVSLTKNLTYNL